MLALLDKPAYYVAGLTAAKSCHRRSNGRFAVAGFGKRRAMTLSGEPFQQLEDLFMPRRAASPIHFPRVLLA
jgi:hypothetical protein